MRRQLPALALAVALVAVLWAAPPGQSTHTTTYDTNTPLGNVNNHTFQSLTIRSQTSGSLTNSTINQTLSVESSSGIRLARNNVGGSTGIAGSSNVRLENNTFAAVFTVTDTGSSTFYHDRYKAQVRLINPGSIRFYGSVFEQGICRDGGVAPEFHNTSPSNPSVPACTTTSTTSTTWSSPSSISPTWSPSPVTTTYYQEPTTKPTYSQQAYELIGGTFFGDIRVDLRDRVTIKDATIQGNLFISWSSRVTLDNVRVGGSIHVDQSNGVAATRVTTSGNVGFMHIIDFRLAESTVGGALGCFRCASGTFENVQVAHEVNVVESRDVRQVNVNSKLPVRSFEPLPTPSPGVLKLDVDPASSRLAFTHQKLVDGAAPADVRLEMTAVTGLAKFHAASPHHPERVGIELESRFEKVREFEDRDGNGAFDLSDLVLREYLVDELEVLAIQQEPLASGGWVGRITYALPPGGTFSLIFTAREDDPDQTKIDVEFLNYPYLSPRSQLALQVRLESAYDWVIESGASEDRLIFFGDGYNGFFSWVHTAEVDGVDRPVTARVLEEHRTEGGQREIVLYLGYARGNHIFHDPSIGLFEALGLGDVPLGNLLVYGTTLVAVLAVLWAMGSAQRRRAT
jgi:hypothetical protein